MKPKDIVKHKESDRIGFITEIRNDLEGNRVDVLFACDLTDSEDYKQTIVLNGGCFDVSELELLIASVPIQ